jgi:hypothetical protein
LYHWRRSFQQPSQVRRDRESLVERYRDAGVSAVLLWSSALLGDPYVPGELNLSNILVVEALWAQPAGRRLLSRLEAARWPRSALGYWYQAVNSPLVEAAFVEDASLQHGAREQSPCPDQSFARVALVAREDSR